MCRLTRRPSRASPKRGFAITPANSNCRSYRRSRRGPASRRFTLAAWTPPGASEPPANWPRCGAPEPSSWPLPISRTTAATSATFPSPADAEIAERLRALDHQYMDAAGSLDSTLFLETLAQHDATVCGAAPIALLLDTLRRLPGEPVYQFTLDYQTSGDRTGDFKHCVSYAALGYFPRPAYDLDATDREALLDAARL